MFDEEGGVPFGAAAGNEGDAGCYIEGEEVRVVLVRIRDGRISDWRETVKDFVLDEGGSGLVNGVGR